MGRIFYLITHVGNIPLYSEQNWLTLNSVRISLRAELHLLISLQITASKLQSLGTSTLETARKILAKKIAWTNRKEGYKLRGSQSNETGWEGNDPHGGHRRVCGLHVGHYPPQAVSLLLPTPTLSPSFLMFQAIFMPNLLSVPKRRRIKFRRRELTRKSIQHI